MEPCAMHSAKAASAKSTIDLLTDENHCSACRDSLAAAAHELKTPLAIMGGYLHLLLTEKLGPLTPQQLEVLTEMQDNGIRLTNFVQNVLSYATLKVDRYEIQYEVADINACLREIAEFWVQRFQDKAIAFYFFPDEKLPAFAFDWYKVQHIVSNLLDNAMKYTPSTGPGIAPAFQQEIFEECFRLTSQGTRAAGHGLGLAIARRLVQAAGGKIWVESEPGAGSKFSFLCLLNPPAQKKRTAGEP